MDVQVPQHERELLCVSPCTRKCVPQPQRQTYDYRSDTPCYQDSWQGRRREQRYSRQSAHLPPHIRADAVEERTGLVQPVPLDGALQHFHHTAISGRTARLRGAERLQGYRDFDEFVKVLLSLIVRSKNFLIAPLTFWALAMYNNIRNKITAQKN